MHDTVKTVLIATLEEEYTALRTGNLPALEEIGQRKAALESELPDAGLAANELEEIRLAAERNTRLLAAAINGVKDARTRLHAVDAVRKGLDVYTADGLRETVAQRRSALERKA